MISDFGLSKFVGAEYSVLKSRVGTPTFWAPEVAELKRETDNRKTETEKAGKAGRDL
jgi:serine/threonine protein kinase